MVDKVLNQQIYGERFTGFASCLFVKDSVKVERVPFVMASDDAEGAYVVNFCYLRRN